MSITAQQSAVQPQVGVYECEITLKFRIIEEDRVMQNREDLLELLIDAFAYGSDEFVDPLESTVEVAQISEVEANPLMRRQLIRLRNIPCE